MSVDYEVVEIRRNQIKKTNKIVTFQGKEYIASDLAREQQLPKYLMYKYIKEGLNGDDLVQKTRLTAWRHKMRKLLRKS